MAPAAGPIGAAGGGGGAGGNSSCLTLFGLTYDATEREVHILFSACPGYVRCIVVPPKGGKQQLPYAFVQFDSQANALQGLELRHGTTWEEGGQAVNIELSKRDIPERFQSRQQRVADYAPVPQSLAPPAKRQRVEASHYADPYHSPIGGGGAWAPEPAAEDGPRTLHIGGLPAGIVQADLDAFLADNFSTEVVGGKLAGGGKGDSARAFVGFVSHEAAASAQAALEGLSWEGSMLHVEWARTEFRPLGGGGAAASHPPAAQAPQRIAASARHDEGSRSWKGGKGGYEPSGSKGDSSWKGKHGGKGGKDDGGGSKCTLHFTGLPQVTDDEFGEFMATTFPDQVAFTRFVDKMDGRPPVAWVRFVDEASAGAVASSHYQFEWFGSQVMVQFARTELDPSKAGKGK